MIVKLEEYEKALNLAKEAILKDELIIYPTDTLYGLGANALSEKAIEKVFEAKKRENKPVSIMVANLEMLNEYCRVDEKQEKLLLELLPGPYTIILGKKYNFSKL
ncbi:Sua5/YciO/YrdC/YwlC family protein, partial [Candidatus Micrarchaeota archaeon]|nr:Sua5/YciO/YrdC/YwlC family protein [Candidatus Micrarchaeota archaeon]